MLVGAAGVVRLEIRPHFVLRCPNGHGADLLLDVDYQLRCQEWLLGEKPLAAALGIRGTWRQCRCSPIPPVESSESIVVERQVEQHRGNERYIQTVTFTYPAAVCARCGKLRDFNDDFGKAWRVLAELEAP